MNPSSLGNLFGETAGERILGVVGFIGVTVAMASVLLDLRLLFTLAWATGLVAIVGWNTLVLLRRRRTAPPGP